MPTFAKKYLIKDSKIENRKTNPNPLGNMLE